jgi:hypothetical protein
MSTYHIHKGAAVACFVLAGLVNLFIGVGNSLFLMLAAIYFQLNAMEYAQEK